MTFNKFSILLLCVVTTNCVSRGKPIAEQIPEYNPKFVEADFVRVKDKNGNIYYHKKFVEARGIPNHFEVNEYTLDTQTKPYPFYIPVQPSRATASVADSKLKTMKSTRLKKGSFLLPSR